MKDFLESLELGESKYKLSKEEIKSILAENGKAIKTETEKIENKYVEDITAYKETIDDLKKQIENSPKTEEMENLKEKIATYEKQNADREAIENAKKQDEILTKNVNDVIGDLKFVNDFTKNAIINKVKDALKDSANIGKSAKDLFDEITKGQDNLFENPNKIVDMPSIDENVESVVSKEDFDKMGYKERVEFKSSNPVLFNKYNNE